jgi:hypothetical protein
MPLAHFAVAFNGASWTDPDSIALMVMQTMLGSWNKSAGGGKHMGLVPSLLHRLSSCYFPYVCQAPFVKKQSTDHFSSISCLIGTVRSLYRE